MTDHCIYEFGPFRLDPAEHLLLCDGTPVQLTEKVFQVLLALVRKSGHLIEKSELVAAVWGDTFIEEGNLTVTISMLRKALGDDRTKKRFIETVSKQGYRFLAPVTKVPAAAAVPEGGEDTSVTLVPAIPVLHASKAFSGASRASLGISTLALVTIILLMQARVHSPKSTDQSHFAVAASPSDSTVGNTLTPVTDRNQLSQPGAIRDPEAHRLYIEGRYYWNKRTEDGFRHSIECFQQAILKEPRYAAAYAGLADSYTLLASYGVEPPTEAYPNAKAAATKALELNDKLAEAHTSLGLIALYYEWDWQQADREFKKAIELDPGLSGAHAWDSLYYAVMGQTSQSLQQALNAEQLDPLSLAVNMDLGSAYYWNRQFDKAVVTYKRVIALDPYFARAHSRLGIVLAAQKDYAGAVREFQETSRLAGPDPYIDGLMGYAEALGGNPKAARRLLAEMKNRPHQQYVPAFSLALLYLGIGDRNQAIKWLERACQDRSTYMIFAKVDPLLDPLRSDQRFDSLLKQMDLRELAAENDPANPTPLSQTSVQELP